MVDFYTNDYQASGELYSYKKQYQVIQISDKRKYFGSLELFDNSNAQALSNGCAAYGNHLRNGFAGSDIPLNLQDKIELVDSISVNRIYTVNQNVLIDESGRWTLFDCNVKKVLATDGDCKFGTAYACTEKNFMVIGSLIEEYSDKGKLLNRLINYASDLYFYDVFRREDNFVFSGVQNDPHLPESYPYYGTIQVINRKHISKTRRGGFSDVKKRNIFTFFEGAHLPPVFSDQLIYQPFSEGIIVLDYNLQIKHLFKLDETPLFCSMNSSNTLLFTLSMIDKKYSLFISTIDGLLVNKLSLPEEFDTPVMPPVISVNNNAMIVTESAIIAVSPDGKIIWNYKYPQEYASVMTYALLYNNSLAVCHGHSIAILNISTGNILFSKYNFDEIITTPLIYNGKKVLFGTYKRLYELIQSKE